MARIANTAASPDKTGACRNFFAIRVGVRRLDAADKRVESPTFAFHPPLHLFEGWRCDTARSGSLPLPSLPSLGARYPIRSASVAAAAAAVAAKVVAALVEADLLPPAST